MTLITDSFDFVQWLICTTHSMQRPANDNSPIAALAGVGIYPMED